VERVWISCKFVLLFSFPFEKKDLFRLVTDPQWTPEVGNWAFNYKRQTNPRVSEPDVDSDMEIESSEEELEKPDASSWFEHPHYPLTHSYYISHPRHHTEIPQN
jgi:hypothetical protein